MQGHLVVWFSSHTYSVQQTGIGLKMLLVFALMSAGLFACAQGWLRKYYVGLYHFVFHINPVLSREMINVCFSDFTNFCNNIYQNCILTFNGSPFRHYTSMV